MTRISLLAVSTAALLAACGASRQAATATPQTDLDRNELMVEVENQNFYDATIYALDGGHRQRLGRVNGKTTESFTFRWPQHRLRMVIDFTGAGSIVSDELPVSPGEDDNLKLIIGAADHQRAR
jgi:hypothetical protein